jgi:SAM-dependent methyltransferase
MATHQFSTADNKRFWTSNQASYQAQRTAATLLFLTRDYIGRRVLDAGAADGSLMKELEKQQPNSKVTGVDLAPKHPSVEAGDLTNLRFLNESFDTAFCLDVIEHVSPEVTSSILCELTRVLAPGGTLVLTTPYAENLAEANVTCPDCNCTFHRWGHQQRFLEADFAGMAAEHGLEPIMITPVRFSRVARLRFLGSRFFRTRFMRARLGRNNGRQSLLMVARKPCA